MFTIFTLKDIPIVNFRFGKSPDTDGRQKLLRDYDYARPIKEWLRLVVHSDSR